MTDIVPTSRLSRRALLQIGGGGLVAIAGAGTLSAAMRSPGSAQAAAVAPVTNPSIDRIFALAGTDGWVSLRGAEVTDGNQVVFPDPLGEDRNMYNYGFRDASRWQRILQTVDPNSAAGREAHAAIYSWKGETQNASRSSGSTRARRSRSCSTTWAGRCDRTSRTATPSTGTASGTPSRGSTACPRWRRAPRSARR